MGADPGLIVKIKYVAFLFSLILFKVHRVQIYARVLLYNVETDGNHRDSIALFLASHSQFRAQEILPCCVGGPVALGVGCLPPIP